MESTNFYKRFVVDKSIAEKLNFNPYYCRITSGIDGTVEINGKEFVDLASNNYLGLAGDERVKNAMIEAVKKYGASMCGTPIATGYVEIFKNLEDKLSEFVGLESTTIFPSCYQANCGLFSKIAGKEDLIIVDHYVHASLIEGIKTAGCKIKPFLHNNVNHLKKLLEKSTGYRQVFVVTESVFSTEGSIAPFDEIVGLCTRYDALPIIDDSHGIGVIGKTGRGILEEKGIKDFQGIYTASLGKAVANTGGMISGKKEIIEYLRYSCSSLIYSTALPPAILGGIEKVIEIIESEFDSISRRIWRYKTLISERLIKCGFQLENGQAPITSIFCGSFEDTIKMAKRLYEHNILSTPFVPPSVPQNKGRVRLIAGADLKERDIEKALEAFAAIAPKELPAVSIQDNYIMPAAYGMAGKIG